MDSIIYFAAPLFNGPDRLFNFYLTKSLEKKGHKVILPQRDGFEFSNLEKYLKHYLNKEEVSIATKNIINSLDLGKFVRESNIVLARIDEPSDAGVDDEIAFSKMIGKFVIGYRTDSRTPYGNFDDCFGGAHFFPTLRCDYFLNFSNKTRETPEEFIDFLSRNVDLIIQRNYTKIINSKLSRTPDTERIFKNSEILFNGIDNIHNEESLKQIANRYNSNKDYFNKNSPKRY